MKLIDADRAVIQIQSRPARGGWVEMRRKCAQLIFPSSRPARGGWVEISLCVLCKAYRKTSRPARGGWVEIGIRERLLL